MTGAARRDAWQQTKLNLMVHVQVSLMCQRKEHYEQVESFWRSLKA